jgi:tRNA pseudouridine38-40 synthase
VGVNQNPERRFRLTLHYDGSYFLGWQSQAWGRTVQGDLEAALTRLTGTRRPVEGAGRTDSGVHATGQVAATTLPSRWEAQELQRALNAVLPNDIWVETVSDVPLDFHPRFSARARSYRYQVGISPQAFSPFHSPYCWPLIRELDLDLLHRSAALIPGEHSFRAFAKAGQEARGDLCRVMEAGWAPWEEIGVAFHISANRFLHHMVRYLVGTMVEIARGWRELEELLELLTDPDTALRTSPPAPPEGLFLSRVHYTEPVSGLD